MATQPVNQMMVQSGPSVFYDPNFMDVLEDHMTFLRRHPQSRLEMVSDHLTYRYEGDLAGLFFELRIPQHLHFVVMRMNNLNSYSVVPRNIGSLLLPSESVVDNLASVYSSTLVMSQRTRT